MSEMQPGVRTMEGVMKKEMHGREHDENLLFPRKYV
jgi:hypothetical protein